MTTTTTYNPAAIAADLDRLRAQLDDNRRVLDDVGRTLARLTALCLPEAANVATTAAVEQDGDGISEARRWAEDRHEPQGYCPACNGTGGLCYELGCIISDCTTCNGTGRKAVANVAS